MQRKRFCSGTGQNSMKLGLDRKVEFEKSLKFYRQILVRVLAKVALNFVNFAWHGQKVSEIQQIFDKLFKTVLPNLAKTF
jgi:hypothetical protein